MNNFTKLNITATQSGIMPGAGFSTDAQQIAPNICFNSTISSISGRTGKLMVDQAMTFSDLQKELKIDVSAKASFFKFSSDAKSSYLREIEDKDYSLSLSYVGYVEETVSLTLHGRGEEALNDAGKSFYSNGTDEYFGLNCGDWYVTSYQQGGSLVMNINIHFHSHYDKQQFTKHAGASYGNLFSASVDIEKTAKALNIHGTVGLTAFQSGGNPTELGKILNKDASGNYYILSCDLTNMDACKKSAQGLLNYANEDFTKQFDNVSAMTTRGTGFMAKRPIKYINLKTPDSLVTPEVVKARLALDDKYEENMYYHNKLYQLLEGYPVQWDVDSNLYKNIAKLEPKIKTNIDIMTDPSGTTKSIADCFNEPDMCPDIAKQIISQLHPVTQDDLSFMPEIKYAYEIYGGKMLKNGDDPYKAFGAVSIRYDYGYLQKVTSVSISDQSYNFDIHVVDINGVNCRLISNPKGLLSTDGGKTFSGKVLNIWYAGQEYEYYTYHRLPSEYAFELYNSTLGENSTFTELDDI